MNFKRLTTGTGKRIVVNFDLVTEIWPVDTGAKLYFGCSDGEDQACSNVIESVPQIMDILEMNNHSGE